MDQLAQNIPILITEEGVKKFLENKEIQERIQEIKETGEYKSMNKLLENPILKAAIEDGPDNAKEYLQEFDKTYEEKLFVNVIINAVKVAFEKFVDKGGEIDINHEIRDFITTKTVVSINNALINDIAQTVGTGYIANLITEVICDVFEEKDQPPSEEES